MEQKILLEDDSGDKDCFTIIPNYILNHSTALDQALYSQLKRLAGDGKKNYCYPSLGYLMKQLKVGKKALKNSFNYLIKNKWIDNLGKRQIMTAGGKQWVNSYKINNIWKMNNEFYKGSSESTPLVKVVSKEPKGGLKEPKGGLVVACNKERIKNIIKNNVGNYYLFNGERCRVIEQPQKSGKYRILVAGQWQDFGGKIKDLIN